MSGCCLNHEAPKSYFHHNRSIPQRGHKVRRTLTPGFVAHTDDTPWAWPGCQGDVTPPFQIGSHFRARLSVSLIAWGWKVGLTGECDNTWFSGIPLAKSVKSEDELQCSCHCIYVVCVCVRACLCVNFLNHSKTVSTCDAWWTAEETHKCSNEWNMEFYHMSSWDFTSWKGC